MYKAPNIEIKKEEENLFKTTSMYKAPYENPNKLKSD